MALSETGEYEVHVYQMGWRAGGKCATGRESENYRTRQNGSHYLFGCYHNSFALIRRAHRILEERGGAEDGQGSEARPFGSFFEDFVARNLIVAHGDQRAEGEAAELGSWYRYLPQNMAVPGEGDKFPSPFDYLLMASQLGFGTLFDGLLALLSTTQDDEQLSGVRVFLKLLPVCPFERGLWARCVRSVFRPFRWSVNHVARGTGHALRGLNHLEVFLLPPALLNTLAEAKARVAHGSVEVALKWVKGARRWAGVLRPRASRGLRRSLSLVEFVAVVARGYRVDGLNEPGGFEAIDAEDFREWLRRHGASEDVIGSALVTTWYDATISYVKGERGAPACSAGVALQAILRSLLTYKGAFAFQMRAEVGDSFIAPVVRALELQGVRFHFYHRVKRVVVNRAEQAVDRVVFGVQRDRVPERAEFLRIRYRAPGGPKERLTWPAAPLEPSLHLEPPLDSYYSDHEVSEYELTHRRFGGEMQGFDVVVCALPVQVVEDVLQFDDGTPVGARPGPWRSLFEGIQLVESQAIRMWFRRSLNELGWRHEPPILSAFHWPYSTWEDNSHATEIHAFPAVEAPRSIATVFGPLETGSLNVRCREHVQEQQRRARSAAEQFLDASILTLWSGLAQPGGAVDWDAFIDLEAGAARRGRERFQWQHVVANVGPNDSYVLATPGTLRFRLRPDESGFRDLYLAGDWTRNGVEAGTVEGAVISGLKAARSISGHPERIVGGDDFDRGALFR